MSHRATARSVIASLAVLLVACVVPPPASAPVRYVAPTTGPTAKLVMRGQIAAGDIYGVYVLDDTERCTGRRLVGVGGPGRNPATTTLAASQMQTVEYMIVKPNKAICTLRWTFTPVAGKSYLLTGVSEPNKVCVAGLMDMTDPENLKPEPTALRRNPGTEQCVSLARAKTLTTTSAERGGDAVLRPGAKDDDLQGLIGK